MGLNLSEIIKTGTREPIVLEKTKNLVSQYLPENTSTQENNHLLNSEVLKRFENRYNTTSDQLISQAHGNTHLAKAAAFDEWSGSEENYENSLNGVDSEFKMFNFDASTYSKDLKTFAQDYITAYDEDENGVLDENEFIKMATNDAENVTEETKTFLKKSFAALNIDNDSSTVSASEFASFLYVSDLDMKQYAAALAENPDTAVTGFLDGKISFTSYQGLSSLLPGDEGFNTLDRHRTAFYNNFYKADDEAQAAPNTTTNTIQTFGNLYTQLANTTSNSKTSQIRQNIETTNNTIQTFGNLYSQLANATSNSTISQIRQNITTTDRLENLRNLYTQLANTT